MNEFRGENYRKQKNYILLKNFLYVISIKKLFVKYNEYWIMQSYRYLYFDLIKY